MAKIGRNDPCPCGSRKKFKHCHGAPKNSGDLNDAYVRLSLQKHMAQEVQRQRQQGNGKPIISVEFSGMRFVAVRNRLIYGKWATFHDFLFEYIKLTMGEAWWKGELAKPLEEQHPILQWGYLLHLLQKKNAFEVGKVQHSAATGAAAAYLSLAYDLYCMDHNAELQEKLVNRIKHTDQFYGAKYEAHIAGALIRAGFTIEFEDEADRQSTHCEFTATYVKTGAKFSVEVKQQASQQRFRVGRQFIGALAKAAKHQRIVFVDLNRRDSPTDEEIPNFLLHARKVLRRFEGGAHNGQSLPSAYLVITNFPWHHHLEDQDFRCSVLAEGFQIPDFKGDTRFNTLREAIISREKHTEMFALMDSLRDHHEVPATFDGANPELAFNQSVSPLIVGQRYQVRDETGHPCVGTLISAQVMESESRAACVMKCDDGQQRIVMWPLSETEMKAWRLHPDTFFGVVTDRHTTVSDPLGLYDFFLKGCAGASIEQLLAAMAGAPDFEQLRQLSRDELASIHAERMVYGAMRQNPEMFADTP
ncbi:MAG TPA: SEC-C domain-containing protein [Paucimonas sp.]|nr:SEC-C domain-containing protein [Paucimonas sp.]